MKGFKTLVTAALVCAAFIHTEASVVGEIEIDGMTLYVWRMLGSATVENGAITVSGNTRLYLLESPSILVHPDELHQVSLFAFLIYLFNELKE